VNINNKKIIRMDAFDYETLLKIHLYLNLYLNDVNTEYQKVENLINITMQNRTLNHIHADQSKYLYSSLNKDDAIF
jgi:hypothetical protein